jgi:hypothetical protein
VASAPAEKAAPAAAAPMTDEEKRRAPMDLLRQAGWQMGAPLTPDLIDKAKGLAKEKNLDPDLITQFATRMAERIAQGGGGRGGRGGGGGGGGGGGRGLNGGGTGVTSGVGMNISNQPRTVYKLVTDAAGKKYPQPVSVHLGISDGTITQVLDGVAEGDTLITYVTMPGAAAPTAGPPGQSGNPFQQGGRGGFGGGFRDH